MEAAGEGGMRRRTHNCFRDAQVPMVQPMEPRISAQGWLERGPVVVFGAFNLNVSLNLFRRAAAR